MLIWIHCITALMFCIALSYRFHVSMPTYKLYYNLNFFHRAITVSHPCPPITLIFCIALFYHFHVSMPIAHCPHITLTFASRYHCHASVPTYAFNKLLFKYLVNCVSGVLVPPIDYHSYIFF